MHNAWKLLFSEFFLKKLIINSFILIFKVISNATFDSFSLIVFENAVHLMLNFHCNLLYLIIYLILILTYSCLKKAFNPLLIPLIHNHCKVQTHVNKESLIRWIEKQHSRRVPVLSETIKYMPSKMEFKNIMESVLFIKDFIFDCRSVYFS